MVSQATRFVDFVDYKKNNIGVNNRTILMEIDTLGVSFGGITVRKASGDNITVSVFVSYQAGLNAPTGNIPASWANFGWIKLGNDTTVSGISEIKIDRPYHKIAVTGIRTGSNNTTADIAAFLTNRS